MILSIKPWVRLRKKNRAPQRSPQRSYVRALDWYLAVNMFGMAVVILSIMLVVALLSQSLKLINFMTDYGAPMTAIIPLFVALAPYWLELVLPFAFAFAVMSVYHQMEASSELTVMRASGISHVRLALPVVALGGLFVLLGYGLSLYISPLSQGWFRDIQHDLKKQAAFVPIREGRFTDIGRNVIIYVPRRDTTGPISSLFIHDNRDAQNPVTILARRGQLVRHDDGLRLSLVAGSHQTLSRKRHMLSVLDFDEYDMLLYERGEQVRSRHKPNEKFLSELFSAEDNAMWVEGHRRLIKPFLPVVFGLIVAALMLTARYARRQPIRPMVMACGALLMMKLLEIALFHASGNYAPWMIGLTYLLLLVAVALSWAHLANPRRAERLGAMLTDYAHRGLTAVRKHSGALRVGSSS
ncbi:MAG: LptF/LptG family permease [Alphaproteobacteria bacterium GM202ARS2]|nr:LptF/LptG family permease [Alphaproteobacteria bacterium GM202ARS2]